MIEKDALVNMKSTDGDEVPCRILDIFEFGDGQYALLSKLSDESMVIMRMFVKDGGTVFRYIESDEEFDSVVAHVEMLSKQITDDSELDE